jgi:hypothetical protein
MEITMTTLTLNELLDPAQLLRELDEIEFGSVNNKQVRLSLGFLCDVHVQVLMCGGWTENLRLDCRFYALDLEESLKEANMLAEDEPMIKALELITDRVMLLGLCSATQQIVYENLQPVTRV